METVIIDSTSSDHFTYLNSPIKIIIPLPPSDNERLIPSWRSRRLILSSKYRSYKQEIAKTVYVQMREQGKMIPFETSFDKQLKIYVTFYLKNKRRDAMDMFKCMLDSMSDILYDTDKWVVPQISFPYKIDSVNPRVELTV